jgi:CAAX protease family protein
MSASLPLRRPSTGMTVLLASTAVEILVFYLGSSARFAGAPLFERLAVETAIFAIPSVFIVRAVLREPLGEYGLTWGAPRIWGPWVAALLLVVTPILIAATRIPAMHEAYPIYAEAHRRPWLLVPSTLAFGTYGLAWEFFFRGFVTLGTRARVGKLAILLQAVPCALLHAGKPAVEIAASFPTALLLGMLSYRTGSVLPGWLLHTACSAIVNVACLFP